MKITITKKLVMTYSAVLAVFLIITVVLLNITARRSLKNALIKNLHTESAIIEELYRERAATSLSKNGGIEDIDNAKSILKSWFTNIKKLADIGFASDIAFIIKTNEESFGVFTPGETQNEINFRSISHEDLKTRLKDQPYFFNITGAETPYFAVSRPLSDENIPSTSLRAWIIAYTPVHDLNILVRDMNLRAAFAVGTALVFAAFLSYFLSLSISKPIKTLKAHAEKIASRDFQVRANINTGDEIESLAHAMNKIAGDLSDYDQAQRRFLQNVTHELKTPVMSVMGYAEGLRDGVIEDRDKALNIIIGECERLQRLVNEVLYLSKLETVEEFFVIKSERLNEVIESARDKIQNRVDKAGLVLNIDLEGDCTVEMDRDKLMQALLNLLSNAIRYAASSISIKTSIAEKFVRIYVIDDGTGMDESEIGRIFERFYKGKKGSTGLGMTITKAIVEKHRGSIKASNNPGGGACFTVELPIAGCDTIPNSMNVVK